MKILHTSDWHLGKKLDNFSRHQEQMEVLAEISDIANKEKADIVVIAGDVFDAYNPPVESVELFYKTLKILCKNGNRPVIVIAGNHDSPDRIEAPDSLAKALGILFIGYPGTKIPPYKTDSDIEILRSDAGFIELQLPNYNYPIRILLNPYANQFRLRQFLGIDDKEKELRKLLEQTWTEKCNKYCDNQGINLLLSHMFFTQKGTDLLVEPEDEKPILHVGGVSALYPENIPKEIQYAALGHLHRKQIIGKSPCPVVYSGSPLSYSFGEANQQKFVCMIDLKPSDRAMVKYIALNKGRKLIRKKFEDINKAIEWMTQNQDCLLELTIVSDEYLSAEDRKRIKAAHQNIVNIIPETRNKSELPETSKQIDLSKDIKFLFSDYFKYKTGQDINDELLDLFQELNSKT